MFLCVLCIYPLKVEKPEHIEVADKSPASQRVSEAALVGVNEKIQEFPKRQPKIEVGTTPAKTPEKPLEKEVTEWKQEEPEKVVISEVELTENVADPQKAVKPQKVPERDTKSKRTAEKPTATPHKILFKEAEVIPQLKPQREVKEATPKGTSESEFTSLSFFLSLDVF